MVLIEPLHILLAECVASIYALYIQLWSHFYLVSGVQFLCPLVYLSELLPLDDVLELVAFLFDVHETKRGGL